MSKIQSITTNRIAFGGQLYNTKRQNMDNSESYVQSKLAKLYDQAIADYFVSSKLESIRKFTNNK